MKEDSVMKRINSINKKNLKKSFKDYYWNYYNGEFFRDFRYIWDGLKLKDHRSICFDGILRYNHVMNADKYDQNSDAAKYYLNFMTSQNHGGHMGLLGGEISYFKSYEEYQHGDISARWSDRQFYDLDIESDKVDQIKSDIKQSLLKFKGGDLTKMGLRKRMKRHKSDFRDLIFNHDLLYPTFMEAKNLCEYLEELGLTPYMIFSGSKGFHSNIFYDECRIQNLSQVSKLFAKSFSDKLNLKYLDWRVFDENKAQRRLQRCQYKIHSKTDLMTIPIPDVNDYDEFMQLLKKKHHKPIDFDFNEYAQSSEEFRESLIYNDRKFQRINARRQRELKRENDERRRQLKKKYHGKYKNYSEIDMTDIFRHYGGEIIKEYHDKAIVRCLFHADNNPSAVIFKNSNYFYCSSCGKTLNYYGMISEMEGTEDKAKIMAKADEFLK